VIYRYCNESGQLTEEANPNGSIRNIAGISNEEGNVFGMMPHPERATSEILGNTDGLRVFNRLLHEQLQGQLSF
jgi:phosphoribosylformylglycinamidine synthase